ncbi:glycine--tRNA ligase subunit beta [Kozakia baliensis]|uniref:Glycine--tRNA ligase beta subunit n=1 Tax=Kozakia baliensis TaxID=153496 RepID=A0A1D8UUI8_9PROT|nr:glycine--tRNA ligase subunit beta [Kozakia baliensis]AOX17306.1 glycine--tRNA ligase subunit beta [Kozakia baliensis]GBR30004.1 glycyl-tRNA synthetase subunit beta [Kozakia baliensis NRIC 0488]GEL63263.1 glycine--tRNA ligase beta subunit [Kozakia baliensis]
MAELLLVLDSEEIPARMQEAAAKELARGLSAALDGLNPRDAAPFWGPRRIAVSLNVDAEIPASTKSERGPRESAPEQALAGFLRKHGAIRDDLVLESGFWVLNRATPPVKAAERIAQAVPELLWRFPWPKSMRWGKGSNFTWVRPLRRIVCLLDGALVPFALATDHDDAHGLRSGTTTEGHRFMAPEPFEVTSAAQWQRELAERKVVVDATERADRVVSGVAEQAQKAGLKLVPDVGLVDEVAGLTEWPVALLGRIDDAFMDLPPEVMQVSMRINQRYFALRDAQDKAAPFFAFVANMDFADGGALTIAGNERVLRARFADARHFWDLDRKIKLVDRVGALDAVTFHAKLGSQGARVARIEKLAAEIARAMALSDQQIVDAARAARLAKADLTTGMVGEFPELQGVMGGYYARHDGETENVAQAVAEHYMPRGLNDDTPRAPVSVAVALADRIDLLAAFFAIGETPSGSGDPYGLRRAALGVIRIIRDNGLRLDLNGLFEQAAANLPANLSEGGELPALLSFIAERLRVQLRNEGERHDVLAAILAGGLDGDLVRLLARTEALARMLGSEDGVNLLAASKRAANILRIENKKDGPHDGVPDPALYVQDEERALASALDDAHTTIRVALVEERFTDAMRDAAALRPTLDRFFDAVTVNDPEPERRRNRLRLLNRIGETLAGIADFGQIEG